MIFLTYLSYVRKIYLKGSAVIFIVAYFVRNIAIRENSVQYLIEKLEIM